MPDTGPTAGVICLAGNTGLGRPAGQKAGPAPLERGQRPGRPIPAMTENPNPENRPADPERGNSLRAWLIDALALGMGALAVFHYQPEGFVAGLIVFVGAYTLTHSLHGLNWVARGNLRTPAGLARPGDPSGHPYDGPHRHQRHGAGLHVLAARDRASLLALGVVAGDRHLVSPPGYAVYGVAGAACDQDFGADHTRRLACAAFAETPPRPDETTPKTEAALISNANR